MTAENPEIELAQIELSPEEIGLIEAMLFINGEPVATDEIAELTQYSAQFIDQQLTLLAKQREDRNEYGCNFFPVASGWQMVSKKEYTRILQEHFKTLNKPRKLSPTTLETLAIIASKQPISRPEIEMIRGVSADYGVNQLLLLGLIEETGKKPGSRANLYVTTKEFLVHFGLSSLKDLPKDKLPTRKGE
ncbi:MAG: SMC-Scp complex subunit ScpB [Firmicutes bacterium]|jgi:segregation and condensation protein B|nr:SMC-Scp complex subunit ScpB [Bacillota bacterium]